MLDVEQQSEHAQASHYPCSFASDGASTGKHPSLVNRDASIYMKQNSQPSTRGYTTQNNCARSCRMVSSCNESGCKDDGYPGNGGTRLGSSYSGCIDFHGHHATSPDGVSTVIHTSHSELSFKCLGDNFFNEGSWLRKTSDQWTNTRYDYLPEVLVDNMPRSIDIEGWISDSTGSSCSDSDNEDDLVGFLSFLPGL